MTAVVTVNTRRGKARVVDFDAVALRQELNKPANRDEVQRALPRHEHYTSTVGWARRLMVSWPVDQWTLVPTSDWAHLIPADVTPTTVDKRGVCWKAHGGLVLVSPARGVIGTFLEHAGLRVVFLNTHLVSSAWSARKVPGKKWRRRKWRKHKALIDHITEALTGAGFLVVIGGDFNRGITLEFPGLVNPRGHKPAGIEAYDQLAASPELDPRDQRRAGPKAGSDHYPQAIDIGSEEAPMPDDLTINQRFYRALKDDPTVPAVLRRDEWGSNPDGRRWALAPNVDNVYQWRRANKPHSLLPDDPSDTLVQHVTVTDDTGDTTGSFKADMQALERIGFARFGSGVSYNVVVDQDGMVGIGMPLDAKGTHTVNDKNVPGFSYDQNKVALAVAWIAKPGDPLTQACKTSIAAVIRALRAAGALTAGFDYVPHSLFAAKACPLQNMRDAMPGIRAAGTASKPDPEPPVEEKPTRVSNGRLLVEQGIELIGQTPDERKRAQALAEALQAVLDDPGYPTR